MAVIWGLDLHDMQWNKFKSSYMWDNQYYLRRTKFIVYQLAMICCVLSESLGTAALSDYNKQQKSVSARNPAARVYNNDFIAICSYNIFAGIYVSTIFGSAFFFDLFWPERTESKAVKLAWRICSVLACLLTAAAAILLTIIVFTKQELVTGVSSKEASSLLAAYHGSPTIYRNNGRAVAAMAFIWPGMLATFASTCLIWHSLSHIDTHGPKSTHARGIDDLPEEKSEIPANNDGTADSDAAALPPLYSKL